MMDDEVETLLSEALPSAAHRYVDAMPTSEVPAIPAGDWRWLERFLPYSGEAETGVHWFVRFP